MELAFYDIRDNECVRENKKFPDTAKGSNKYVEQFEPVLWIDELPGSKDISDFEKGLDIIGQYPECTGYKSDMQEKI